MNFRNIKKTGFGQRNTPEAWDAFYKDEENKNNRVLTERREWMIEAIKQGSNKTGTFLDVGCGWGETFDFLHTNGMFFKCTGIDICPETIERQQDKQHTFILGSAEKLPFKDGVFNVVWCGETIEHLAYPRKALKEIQRVTKKGGLILITVPLDNFNNAFEHTYYITRKDLCTIYDDCTLINYKLHKESEQCAAFINHREIKVW